MCLLALLDDPSLTTNPQLQTKLVSSRSRVCPVTENDIAIVTFIVNRFSNKKNNNNNQFCDVINLPARLQGVAFRLQCAPPAKL